MFKIYIIRSLFAMTVFFTCYQVNAQNALARPHDLPGPTENHQVALRLLAVAASHSVANQFDFEKTCPIDHFFFVKPGFTEISESVTSYSNQLQFEIPGFILHYLNILAGKSVELFQGDLCLFLMGHQFSDFEQAYDYCARAEHLHLSKASAKSIGEIAKAYQRGKSGFALFSLGVSTYAGVKLSNRISRASLPPIWVFALTTAALSAEQLLQPRNIQALSGEVPSDVYIAFDHWVGSPFVYKTTSVGCRYALNQVIQDQFFGANFQRQLASLILSHSSLLQRTASSLSNGAAVGFSKVGPGALAATILSIAEISYDAMQKEPEFDTTNLRVGKYVQDLGVAVGSNMVMAVALPTTLVAGKPSRIVFGFLLANTIYWAAFSSH